MVMQVDFSVEVQCILGKEAFLMMGKYRLTINIINLADNSTPLLA